MTPKDSAARAVSLDGPAPPFDGLTIDLVLATLPLRPGVAVQVSACDMLRSCRWLNATVAGSENVAHRDAWVIDVVDGKNHLTWYIDRKTGAQVGAVVKLPNGGEMRVFP